MTNQTNADLIATAKAMREQMGYEPKPGSILALWFETADALEAAETLRSMADAYRAEVEQERDNWRLSAEEAERAEKRWKDCAVEADRQARAAEAEAEHLHLEDTREIVALTQERDSAMKSYEGYMTLHRKVAEYAAVVEKVRAADSASSSWDHFGHLVMDILATAPADALREMQAAAWDEGYRSGYIEGQADAHRLDPDDIEETPNPYADSPRHTDPQRREEQP